MVAVPTHDDAEAHGQNPLISIGLEFDETGTNEISPSAYTPFTARIFLEGFSSGGGMTALEFALDSTFSGFALGTTTVLPGGLLLGDGTQPDLGLTFAAAGCAVPDESVHRDIDGLAYTIQLHPEICRCSHVR